MIRSTELTRELLEPAGPPIDDGIRSRVHERLASAIGPMVGSMGSGDQLVVNLPLLRQVRAHPDSVLAPDEPFAWKPIFVRRSLGLAVVEACVSGRFRTPMEAVGPMASEAVSQWQRSGWRTFHWEPWFAGLPAGARAAVLAEALCWATSLWTSFDWRALPSLQIGVIDDQWSCPQARTVRLKGRSELRVPLLPDRSAPTSSSAGSTPRPGGMPPVTGPAALVSVSGGCPTETWPEELAYLALVGGLRSPSRPVPARVVGVWPDAGIHASVEVDEPLLTAAVDRVVNTVGLLVDARRSVVAR